MNQQQGNDLAAPEPLATTEPDESAQGTIEDKLLKYFWPQPYPENKPPIQVTFDNGGIIFQIPFHTFKTAIQAIITTETKKAIQAERRVPKCQECKKPLPVTLHNECWHKQYESLQKEQHD